MNHYKIDDIYIGMKESFTVVVSDKEMASFLSITGDNNPLHCDEEYAVSSGQRGRVVYGMLTASYLSTLAGVYLPGEKSLIHSAEIKWSAPVFPGDTLRVDGVVTDINTTFNFITLKCRIHNQKDVCVLKAKMQVGVRE